MIFVNRICLTLMLALSLIGCESTTESSVSFTYQIKAASDINPDFKGTPSPVVVRIYQLTNDVNFINASYESLFENDRQALGAEYLTHDEYLVHPNSITPIKLEVSENVKHLGIAVGYRSIEMINWRSIIDINENQSWYDFLQSHGIEVQIERLSMRVIKL